MRLTPFKPTPLRIPAFLFTLAAAGHLCAADIYMTPAGAGSKDGSTWENAKAATPESFQAGWDALTPGDTFHVGSGNYPALGIKAAKGGAEGKPVRLIGEDRGSGLPLFTSDFDKHKGGATFFASKEGVSNFEISGFHLKAYQRGVFIRGKSANIKISNMNIEGALEGIRSDGGAEVDKPDLATHNVTVADCTFNKFVKRAIRLQGGNYNWRMDRCWADAGGKEWGTQNFPIAYQISVRPFKPKDGAAPDAPAADEAGDAGEPGARAGKEFAIHSGTEIYAMEHDIEMVDCLAMNCYYEGTKGKSSRYWNGDGFCAERGSKNLKFVRCVSMHNTDGGWDLKTESPEFIDCISIDNKDNFRLWDGTPTLTNCVSAYAFKRGGSGPTSGIWTVTNVELEHCTMINNSFVIDTGHAKGPVSITFKDSIFVGPNPGGQVKMVNSVVAASIEQAKLNAPKTVEVKPGTAFDTAAYPDKGYSSARRQK